MVKDVAINLERITVAYDGEPVLYDASVDFLKGKMTAIVGPNGAGKSTMLKTILEFIEPLAGDVHYFVDEQEYESYKEVMTNIAYVPQKASVDWNFPATVFDVALMGRYGKIGLFGRPKKEDEDIALEMLDKVGILEYKDRQISQLSGGQRQRVFIARALTEQPDIYILDEPLAGVDKATENVIMSLLRDLINTNRTVIVVHHDLNTIESYFDQVLFLNKKIIAQGSVEETFTSENIEKTYSYMFEFGKKGEQNG